MSEEELIALLEEMIDKVQEMTNAWVEVLEKIHAMKEEVGNE